MQVIIGLYTILYEVKTIVEVQQGTKVLGWYKGWLKICRYLIGVYIGWYEVIGYHIWLQVKVVLGSVIIGLRIGGTRDVLEAKTGYRWWIGL